MRGFDALLVASVCACVAPGGCDKSKDPPAKSGDEAKAKTKAEPEAKNEKPETKAADDTKTASDKESDKVKVNLDEIETIALVRFRKEGGKLHADFPAFSTAVEAGREVTIVGPVGTTAQTVALTSVKEIEGEAGSAWEASVAPFAEDALGALEPTKDAGLVIVPAVAGAKAVNPVLPPPNPLAHGPCGPSKGSERLTAAADLDGDSKADALAFWCVKADHEWEGSAVRRSPGKWAMLEQSWADPGPK